MNTDSGAATPQGGYGYVCEGPAAHEVSAPYSLDRCPAHPCRAWLKAVGTGARAENERLAAKRAENRRLQERLGRT